MTEVMHPDVIVLCALRNLFPVRAMRLIWQARRGDIHGALTQPHENFHTSSCKRQGFAAAYASGHGAQRRQLEDAPFKIDLICVTRLDFGGLGRRQEDQLQAINLILRDPAVC